MKRYWKWIIVIASVLLVLVLGLGMAAGNYFYKLALDPDTDKSMVLEADHNKMPESGASEEAEARQDWFDGSGYEEVYMESGDGLRLHGYSIRNSTPSDKWALLCHGYGGRGTGMLKQAVRFYDMGYNVLLPDARGCGESEGDYIGMGWDDRLDVVDWIGEIVKWDMDAQIVLYGVSMGGATVMMVSGEELPGNVKAIVEDCGYSSVWGEFSYQMKELFGIPVFPFMHFASAVTKIKAGFWLGEADAVKQVKKSVTPMMFIHGGADTFVPSYMLDEVYAAAEVPKERMFVEGAAHGGAADTAGEEYWERVGAFIGAYVE